MEERLVAVEERVDRLESVLGQFIVHTDIALKKLEEEITRLGRQWEEERKEMNKRWGELANKMGTLAEDIVAPNISGIAREYFGCSDIKDFMVRRRKKNTKDASKVREFDVIAVCDDKVIINETKSTPKRTSSRMKLRNENREIELDIVGFTEDKAFIVEVRSSPDRQGYIDEFIEKLRVLPEFLPEIKSYEVVPIYAGLTMSESTIEYLTKNNIYALIVKGDILEIANFDKVKNTEG